MKLIAITGHKNSNKNWLAMKLASNSDVVYVRPYTDRKVPINEEPFDDMIHLTDSQLSYKIDREDPLFVKEVNGNRYTFFRTQFRTEYCAIIVSEDVIDYLKKEWDDRLITIYCHTGQGCADSKKYDIVFNTVEDSYDDLEARVEYD